MSPSEKWERLAWSMKMLELRDVMRRLAEITEAANVELIAFNASIQSRLDNKDPA